ncbi:MAG: transposase [Kofleriaceae bacterium]
MVSGFGTLRRRDAYFAIRMASRAVLKRADFRIVHISLEYEHIHLIVEADDDRALSKGIQAFESSAAQHLNRITSRGRGPVFAERYHVVFLRSPTQARYAIAYVLGNWRHHLQDQGDGEERSWDLDYFSSAVSFDGWQELAAGAVLQYAIPVDMRLCVSRPKTWLLRIGWTKAGSISMYTVPGKRR